MEVFVNNRYVYPGGLKLPVDILDNVKSFGGNIETVRLVLKQLKSNLVSNCEHHVDSCVSYRIDRNTTLYADFKNNKMNLYLETPNAFTQILTENIALKIVDKETSIIKRHKLEVSDNQRAGYAKDTLTQKLIHSSYSLRKENRAPPKIFGKEMDEDFELY